MTRAPAASVYQARFPSLVAVVTGGMFLPACEAPACGDNRVDELEAHGQRSADQMRGGHAGEAIREIGVAVGLVRHDGTTTTRVQAPGEAMPVTTMPRPPAQIPIQPSGGVSAVQPDPPPHPRIAPQGGPRAVQPLPPPPPRPRTPPPPPTHDTRAVPGGLGVVTPSPGALHRNRA